MDKAPNERSALKAYIDACLVWPKRFVNEQKRIEGLLTGIGIDQKKSSELSVGIQAMITGAIWTVGLDKNANAKSLRDQILRSIHHF